ncbi:hypothetical protein BDV93DRAFT_506822 [Ceratobasidium sp. AG-I]|nr:hypothetical protein BDV93DRAFT_506822 [Ceratobasidium sp. AG-I]
MSRLCSSGGYLRLLTSAWRLVLSATGGTTTCVMAFQTSKNNLFNTRHRIQEITVQPATSERATRLKLFVDGRNVHELSTIKPGQTLRWDMQTFPCDVHSGSVIGLKLIEKHYMSPDREVLVEYAVSETVNQTSIIKDAGVFPSGLSTLGLVSRRPKTARTTKSLAVAVKFTNLSQIESNHSATFIEAAKMAGEAQGPLDKLGNYRGVLKTILSFGAAVAELYPTARLVIGVFTTAWEYLEKLQEQHEDLQRLIDGLTQMQPFINSVRDRAKEAALDRVVLGLLQLIEDTSNYIINSMNQTNAGRIMQGLGETIVSDCVSELLQKFGDLKEQFDRGVNITLI